MKEKEEEFNRKVFEVASCTNIPVKTLAALSYNDLVQIHLACVMSLSAQGHSFVKSID